MSNIIQFVRPETALSQKRDYLAAILDLTRMQDDFIERVDLDGLLENLNQRQELIDKIDDLEPQFRFGMSGTSTENARLALEINDILAEIQRLDSANQRRASVTLDSLKGEMKRLSGGRRAGIGYFARQTEPTATYFDRRK